MATTLPDAAIASPEDETDAERRRRLRIVVAASLLGTTVEWYDFFLYATAAGLVFNKVFFPDASSLVGTLLAFATFAVGFVMRPIGGLVFGHIGDRIGRKRSLALTMLIMGIATALIGVLPTAAQIGVWAPVLLLVAAHAAGFCARRRVGRRGVAGRRTQPGGPARPLWGDPADRFGAWVWPWAPASSQFCRVVLGPSQFLSYGWRIGFLLSLVLVVVGIVVRLRVDETPAFQELARPRRPHRPCRSATSFASPAHGATLC